MGLRIRCQQLLPTEKQVDQRAGHEQLVRGRFRSVLGSLRFVDPVFLAIATISMILRPGCTLLDDFRLSAIGLIAPHPGLFPMQQIRLQRRVSATFAAVATTVWMTLALLSTPTLGIHPELDLL
jgi:hypothetical protein